MQLFFLVAGFFANMLQQKRGTWNMLQNRLRRVGIPFLTFSLLLIPISYFQFVVGGLASGRIQSSESAWPLTVTSLKTAGSADVMLLHLWFLYYLLMLYVVTLVLQRVLITIGPIRQQFGITTAAFKRLAESRFFLPVAIVLSASLMMFSRGWFGIDSPILGVEPNFRILLEFWIFFAVGWLLYYAPELIEVITNRFRLQLVLGLLLTIPLFWWTLTADQKGYNTWLYPLLGTSDVADMDSLRNKLLDATDETAHAVFLRLPPDTQRFLRTNPTLTPHQVSGITEPINLSMIASPIPFATDEGKQNVSNMTFEHQMLDNRLALEQAFVDAIHSDERSQPYYWPIRGVYALTYSTSMWLLVLGTIGLFRRYCSTYHPVIRYWSDASYWMYLIHINVLFAIQYMMGDWQLHWFPKVIIYLLICFPILLVTYQYLVRGTVIGVLLNGRRYQSFPVAHEPEPTSEVLSQKA